MKITDAHLKIRLGANLRPEAPDTSGTSHIGRQVDVTLANPTKVWAARMIFGATTQNVVASYTNNTLTPSAVGALQVETATVVAASGCTAAGNLALTFTAAGVTGSPVSVSVPLTPAAHPTATTIAAACAAALSATVAIADVYTVTASGAAVVFTRKFPAANDGTLNLAIAAGLGVTAAASSADTTAGAAGVVIQRLGGAGNDIYGRPLPTTPSNNIIIHGSSPAGVNAIVGQTLGAVYPGGEQTQYAPGLNPGETFTCPFGGKGIMDIIVIAN